MYLFPLFLLFVSVLCCPTGQVDKDGICTLCPAGTSWDLAGCFDCTPGFYNAVPGALSCTQCESGTYSTFGGASTCKYYHPVDSLLYLGSNSLSTTRRSISGASYGSLAFFFGGADSTGSSPNLDVFDIAAGTWNSFNNINVIPRYYAAGLAISSKIVFAGGFLAVFDTVGSNIIGSPSVDIFDATTFDPTLPINPVTTLISPSRQNLVQGGIAISCCGGQSAAAVYDGSNWYGFFAGGLGDKLYVSKIVDVFNPRTNSFMSNMSYTLSVGRYFMSSAYSNNIALFAGGYLNESRSSVTNVIDVYNHGVWTTSTLLVARADMASTNVGAMMLFGGGSNNNIASDIVEIYDSIGATWSTTTLSVPRTLLSAASSGSKALFAGGISGTTIYSTVDIYDFATAAWKSLNALSKPAYLMSTLTVGATAMFVGGFGSESSVLSSVNYFSFCPLGSIYIAATCGCSFGQYDNGTQCTDCDFGYYGDGNSLKTSTCSGNCAAVPGHYCTSGSTAAIGTICPLGTYGDIAGLTSSSCSGSCTSVAGYYCDAGQTLAGGSICPLGRYGSSTGLTSAACSGPCNAIAGNFCEKGATSSIGSPCLPGTYQGLTGQSNCLTCNFGFYSGSGASACTSCDYGTYNEKLGASACAPASIGHFVPSLQSVAMLDCSRGTFSNQTGLSICFLCKDGTSQPDDGKSSCIDCDVGFYSLPGSQRCSVCDRGTYSNEIATAVCTKCPVGKFQNTTQSTSCFTTEPGFSQDLVGQEYQKSCSRGTFNSNFGSTACQPCAVGFFASLVGQSICSSCDPGRYTDRNETVDCTPCETGTYSNTYGLTQCLLAYPGTFVRDNGQSSVNPCEPGFFSDQYRATACSKCSGGTFSIGNSSFCSDCSGGTYSQISSSACTLCRVGTSSKAGSPSCTECSAGEYSEFGFSACLSCQPGSFSGGTGQGACTFCPPGQFTNSTGSALCLPCRAGTFSDKPGSLACQFCVGSTWSQPAQNGATVCSVCALGKKVSGNTTNNGPTSCDDCPAGKHGILSADDCVPCETGLYSAGGGASSCQLCPEYFFVNGDQTNCIDSYRISSTLSYAVYSVSSVLGFVSVITLIFVIYHHDKKVISSASTKFLCAILIGMVLIYLAAMAYSTTQTPLLCEAKVWLLAFGLNLIFGSLFAKSWRLDKIFNSSSLKVVVYSDFNVFCRVLPVYFYDAAVLIWQGRVYPYSLYPENVFSCFSTQSNSMLLIIGIPKLVLLLYGLYLTWQIRHIDDRFNESKYIVASVWHLAIAVSGIILMFFALQSTVVREVNLTIAASCLAIFVCFATYAFIFGPKIFGVLFQQETKTNVELPTTTKVSTTKDKEDFQQLEELERLYAEKVEKYEADKQELGKLLQAMHAYMYQNENGEFATSDATGEEFEEGNGELELPNINAIVGFSGNTGSTEEKVSSPANLEVSENEIDVSAVEPISSFGN